MTRLKNEQNDNKIPKQEQMTPSSLTGSQETWVTIPTWKSE